MLHTKIKALSLPVLEKKILKLVLFVPMFRVFPQLSVEVVKNDLLHTNWRRWTTWGSGGPGSLTWVIFPTNEFYIFVPFVPTCDPQRAPILIPRGIIWIKFTKVYKEMLHTKSLSSIPSSFREEEFWSWSSLFLCCGVSFDSKGIIWINW